MDRILYFNALPAQGRFLASRAQFAGLFGGIGSGKSTAGCFWALVKALRNPRCLGLVAANSYRQLHDATLRTFETLLRRYGVPYRFHAGDLAFRLGNGAEVLCRSLENYDLLRGVELGWFYLDELRDTRFEAWCVVKGRLRSPNVDAREGRVTSSPNGFNWMHDEFVRKPSDPATAAEYANHEAIFARTADNHHLPGDYVEALRASYDPRLAAQELDGRFVNTTAGRLYHAFERAAHVSPEAEFAPGQPLLWALDFNVTPMTAVIAQMDAGDGADGGDGARPSGLRVVDEIWLTNAGTQAMCEAMEEWLRRNEVRCEVLGVGGPDTGLAHRPTGCSWLRTPTPATQHLPPVFVYGDAAGHARSTAGRSDYAIIRECFPWARLCVGVANPARRDRYNAVNAALRNARGEVRLRIHPRCRRLIDDLEQAAYQPDTGLPDTANPLRGHLSDALGYLVARVMPAGSAALRVGQW
ncbi:MAG TPA: phage terminase large subunit [Planctomycetota bacterium]|nr:phage terminase large subunit [Planctomycetota bacterium]HRT97254.1 phage terminase large subunit [Planctomycetota bacterium]